MAEAGNRAVVLAGAVEGIPVGAGDRTRSTGACGCAPIRADGTAVAGAAPVLESHDVPVLATRWDGQRAVGARVTLRPDFGG